MPFFPRTAYLSFSCTNPFPILIHSALCPGTLTLVDDINFFAFWSLWFWPVEGCSRRSEGRKRVRWECLFLHPPVRWPFPIHCFPLGSSNAFLPSLFQTWCGIAPHGCQCQGAALCWLGSSPHTLADSSLITFSVILFSAGT